MKQPDLQLLLVSRFCTFITNSFHSSNYIVKLCSQLSLFVNPNVHFISQRLGLSQDELRHSLLNYNVQKLFSVLLLHNDETFANARVLCELLDVRKGHCNCILLDYDEIDFMIDELATR